MTAETRDIVALLPLKAHSERLPEKNFRDFCGKPLFRWILDTLLSLSEIERVVINTDARQILSSHGLEESERVSVRERPAPLCGDFVSMNQILQDDIAHVPAQVYLMTHVTNPLLGAATIARALARFDEARREGFADSLFSVNRFQTRFYRKDGQPINHDPARLLRTQDLEVWYEENSNLYLFTARSFERTGARIGARPLLFETPRAESVDIDDAESWRMAELLARGLGRAAP